MRNCARSMDYPPCPVNPTRLCKKHHDSQCAKLRVNLQRCCRKCHHKTTLASAVQVGASGHSPVPATGLLRLDRKRKALPALRCAPRPQIRECSHRRANLAPASPLFVFQSQSSGPVVCPSRVRGEWRTGSTEESSVRVWETRGGVETTNTRERNER